MRKRDPLLAPDPGARDGEALLSPQTDIVRLAAAFIVAAVLVAALYLGRDVLLPLAVAFLIGFALNPFVSWLARRGLPRLLAVILVMVTVFAFIAGLGVLLATQVRALSTELPTYQTTIREKLSDLRAGMKGPGMLEGALETVDAVQKEMLAEPEEPAADGPQRVEIVGVAKSPFETAFEWLVPMLEPLATAGIVFVFVFLALLDRSDLRDRLLRLLGGNLHRSTTAIEEAGTRISKYLLMQLLVNLTYAVPMALGLWLIGVPGALLWGTVAGVMRFIPYIGPMISAVFPIALAFAVDPGWSMVLLTVGLIVALELASNNVVEPMLYGTSTGLSAMSLIAAATFWTLLWGPVGLVLSTPLTVCLLVIGRNLPQLQFLDTLLGSSPALDVPTRIYQRLLADDPEEAIDIAIDEIEASSLVGFYNDTGMAVLRLAGADHGGNSTAEHRLRVANGMDELLDDLREEYPADGVGKESPRVVCLGGKWHIDAVAAEMLAHALAHEGIPADFHAAGGVSTRHVAKLELEGADVVCLSYFSPAPAAAARQLCRRLRHRFPHLRIVLALWNSPPDLLKDGAHRDLGADAVVASVDEAVRRMQHMLSPDEGLAARTATEPENDPGRIDALHASGVLAGHAREDLDALAKRAADVFDVGFAVISAIDAEREFIIGQSKDLPGMTTADGTVVMPRKQAVCDHVVASGEMLVVPDTERDPRFADHPAITLWSTRFYAGAPLKTPDGHVLGALCLLDTRPHALSEREKELLGMLAADVVSVITGEEAGEPAGREAASSPSATVGQKVPE
ncbi:AI-2E family transporter [Shinella pollutisoli]|uniref:AI-2E family transporter n=1 Tax=Shinella pollutisoli TaxID=2250594 RepID=A0ABV7DGB3_9HYPH